MDRRLQILVVWAVVFLSAAALFGQEKTIDEKEYTSATDGAEKKLMNRTCRSIRTVEIFTDRDAAPKLVAKHTSETVPPDKFHTIDEENGKKTEEIVIGKAIFSRINGGAWKKGAGKNDIGMGDGSTVESETYKMTKNVNLNGKNVNLYERVVRETSYSDSVKQIQTTRYWITTDGVPLKTEYQNQSAGQKSFTRDTIVYEYDPKIKITAPIR